VPQGTGHPADGRRARPSVDRRIARELLFFEEIDEPE
jgi:hypothetical protein